MTRSPFESRTPDARNRGTRGPGGGRTWPEGLCRPGSPDFERSAKAWLFDLAPPRWRYEEVLHRHPLELARMVVLFLEVELTSIRARLLATRHSPHPTVREVSGVYRRECEWVATTVEQVKLVEAALSDTTGASFEAPRM
ncbi:hypothetical protein [Wenjunlia tyrosinilytica]|uniref:Uncharacterized protein n=1 Tax=Wenjunlia tyrosinilytica TaxID=1544741 RepID=A0A917ZTY4_9ACTN|nr:hypothetical protein [Wenjunlia tyrosinilytica]GGO95142.1 hypothetical protein GCM10012280_51680 [Wenjunlia tyrosinilytica]